MIRIARLYVLETVNHVQAHVQVDVLMTVMVLIVVVIALESAMQDVPQLVLGVVLPAGVGVIAHLQMPVLIIVQQDARAERALSSN